MITPPLNSSLQLPNKSTTITQSSILADAIAKLDESDNSSIVSEPMLSHVNGLSKHIEPVPHKEILSRLIDQVEKVDFREQAELTDENEKLSKKHFLVCSVENVLKLAESNNWGICRNHDFIYLYNGAYWSLFDNAELQTFLGEAGEKMGIDKFDARLYSFREQLYKQFLAVANLPKPEQSIDTVFINLKNGTFEISDKKQQLRQPQRNDFITYQLPFNYNPEADAPLFQSYLNKVLPDVDRQKILAEYLGFVFMKNRRLKLEKFLLLYGSGANGKSVFFEVVNALLGRENVSSYSLQQLTDVERGGSYRAKIGNTLLNYASEINGKLETSVLKAMVSGEPIEARPLYSQPFQLEQYAKLIFNCNELPRDVEQSHAYFRRFLIVPFDVTIPDEEQDKELSKKIIDSELSGVFNWVLDGLKRLLSQKNFTDCEAVRKQVEQYRLQSDSVQMFLQDEGYEKSVDVYKEFKDLFGLYRVYCNDSGYHSCSKKTFGERLRNAGFVIERKMYGLVIYVKK